MSTLDSTLDSAAGESAAAATAETAPRAMPLAGVLTTSDHKVIGTTLVGGSLLGLLAVAAIGALLGLERIDGDGTLFDADVLRQLFSSFRVGLVEAAVVPLLLGLAVYVVPLQVGARSLAFPRAAAAGMWSWLAGIVLLVVAFANNGGPGGSNADFVELFLAANVLTLIGLTAIAATVATSVLTTRAPGMRMHRVPLFSWAALVASLGLVLALPVAAGTHVYLFVDHRYAGGAFGGAADIWAWTAFLYSGPALGLYAVFGLGVVAELVPLTFRRRLPHRFVALIGLGLAATAAFAAVAQQHVVTLPGTGTPVKASNFLTKFGFLANWAMLTLLPVLGVAIVLGLGAYVGRPAKGPPKARPRLTAAFVFGFFGLGLVLAGMLAAAVDGIEDLALAGTVFEEGAAMAVLYGAVLAGLGALAYWFPKISGRTLPQPPLFGLALLGALGAALASAPYLVAGFTDQPGFAGEYANDGPGELWNGAVAIGHALIVLVLLAFAGLAAKEWRAGDAAGDDPWEAHTLEWSTTSPPPADNFDAAPTVMSPEPLLDLRAKPDFAADAEERAD